MGVVVSGLGEEVVVVVVGLERNGSPSDVPELDGLMMASHQAVLFIRIIIDTENA